MIDYRIILLRYHDRKGFVCSTGNGNRAAIHNSKRDCVGCVLIIGRLVIHRRSKKFTEGYNLSNYRTIESPNKRKNTGNFQKSRLENFSHEHEHM